MTVSSQPASKGQSQDFNQSLSDPKVAGSTTRIYYMAAGAKYIADSKCLLTDSSIDASFACLFSMKEER